MQCGTSSVGKVSGLQPLFPSAAVVAMIELAIKIANMDLFALRDCKCYNANKAKGGKKKKATGKKQVRWNPVISSAEEERILFESKVDDELSKLYVNDTVLKAMTQSWKDDFDEKKSLFEEQVRFVLCRPKDYKLHEPPLYFVPLESQLIARYRVAAERGISPEQFTDRFLKALLKEIRGVSRNE